MGLLHRQQQTFPAGAGWEVPRPVDLFGKGIRGPSLKLRRANLPSRSWASVPREYGDQSAGR
jgi:hypothetical protein